MEIEGRSGNSYLVWILLGIAWIGGYTIFHDKIAGETQETTLDSVTNQSAFKDTVEEKQDQADDEQNLPTFEIGKALSEKGFFLSDSKGYRPFEKDRILETNFKSGTGVEINGISKDEKWLIVREDPMLGDYYVPAEKVGRFSK